MEDTIEPRWRKSSYSGNGGADCVEVALLRTDTITVRDSKNPDGPTLIFAPADWRTLTANIKAARLDLS